MKKLIKNVNIVTPTEELFGCIGINGKVIDYIGREESSGYDEIIDGNNGIAAAGFVNAHAHLPMILFRGYAEDMALQPWLFTKIFPAEGKLNPELVRWSSRVGIAEMLAGGTTSFSDMYYFCDEIAKAAIESGIKANISRGITSFAETDPSKVSGLAEANALYDEFNGYDDGRIKIDYCVHAEYTNSEEICRYIADEAKKRNAIIQIHISETESEHNECIQRHGVTPTAFFEQCGCFDVPVTAAHCVWLTDDDMDIFRRHGASAVHNPTSNLKLGSGIARVNDMNERGVNVALGTDGCSSNNNTDMFSELHLASILAKGSLRNPEAIDCRTALRFSNINGAKAQGRTDTGALEVGKAADIIIVGTDEPHMHPMYSAEVALVHSARAADVKLTMVNGEVLYKNGEFLTIDIEKSLFEFERLVNEVYRGK